MVLIEVSDLEIYNPSRIGELHQKGYWVILYKESSLKAWPLPARHWEVEAFLERDEARTHLQELIKGSVIMFTRKSLKLYFRREQFGEGDYAGA